MANRSTFYLNGERCEVENHGLTEMLSQFLREKRGMTGTKVVCAEGDCGACTVLMLRPQMKGRDAEIFLPINSCLMPVANLHGTHILSIEALSLNSSLHPAQKAIVETHGTQCGYCTPGFVMALAGLCEEKIHRCEKEIDSTETKNAFTGNLCRCTGYQSLVEAGAAVNFKELKSLKEKFHSKEIETELADLATQGLKIENPSFTYFAPSSLKEALEYLREHDDVKLIANGTDLGVVYNKRMMQLPHLLSLHLLSDCYEISEDKEIVTVGARVSLNSFRHFLKEKVPEYARYLDLFASPQIKNNATLIGNIANASPIGDNAPVLLALEATVIASSVSGDREIPLSEFFLGYRKTALQKNELISAIKFPLPKKEKLKFLKTSIRKDLDISTVNMAFKCEHDGKKLKRVLIAAGGIAATPIRLKKTEDFLSGSTIDSKSLVQALSLAQAEFQPLSDVRGTEAYRRMVVKNYMRRFFQEILEGG